MAYARNREDQEVDQENQQNSMSLSILGRSYECVFCKRGFTTAQALGGHMNIHRRDRGKVSRLISSSNKQNINKEINTYAGPRFYQPITNLSPHYQTSFQASESGTRLNEYNNWSCGGQSLECSINPFEVDWHMTSLSLQFGGNEERRNGRDDVLDLELRLGYDPR